MDLALNNLQMLVCHKTQTNHNHNQKYLIKILTQELILNEFKLGHNPEEAIKLLVVWKIKHEGSVDYHKVTRGFKKFYLGCKNLDNQARTSRPKIVDSDPVLQAIEANPVVSNLHEEYQASWTSRYPFWWVNLRALANAYRVDKLSFTLPEYCKNVLLILVIILKRW